MKIGFQLFTNRKPTHTHTHAHTKKKEKEKAKRSNFDSIEPNIAKWLCYIHQIQKKKTVKNKNYQFLNFLSNQTDFGSEKRNRECEAKKGI